MGEQAGWRVARSFAPGPGDWTAAVGLADESHFGKIMIHGQDGGEQLAAIGLIAPGGVGEGVVSGATAVYRLRPDQLFISVAPGEEAGLVTSLSAAMSDGADVTLSDITHGRARLRLVGPAAAELLGRACPLDLRATAFPDGAARQSSVARTAQLILRHDLDGGRLPSYVIIGARSLGAYLWDTLIDLGRDLGVRPLGADDYPAGG